ncbi:MAG: hypothetical protein ACSHYA_19795 [Opitutaceae bacterium]
MKNRNKEPMGKKGAIICLVGSILLSVYVIKDGKSIIDDVDLTAIPPELLILMKGIVWITLGMILLVTSLNIFGPIIASYNNKKEILRLSSEVDQLRSRLAEILPEPVDADNQITRP